MAEEEQDQLDYDAPDADAIDSDALNLGPDADAIDSDALNPVLALPEMEQDAGAEAGVDAEVVVAQHEDAAAADAAVPGRHGQVHDAAAVAHADEAAEAAAAGGAAGSPKNATVHDHDHDDAHQDQAVAIAAEAADAQKKLSAASGADAEADPMSLPPHGTEVFVSRMPREAPEAAVRSYVESFGEVVSLRLPVDHKGSNKGYAFVVYKTTDDANRSIAELPKLDFPGYSGRKVLATASIVKNKLFLGNLPRDVPMEELRKLMEADVKGVETVTLLLDKETQQPRGFGFVTFYNNAAAEVARRHFSKPDFRFKARTPTVMWADPKRNESVEAEKVKTLYVGSLPETYTEANLRDIFEPYGHISEITLLHQVEQPNKLRNYAFVHYVERAGALKALAELESTRPSIEGKELTVHLAKPQAPREEPRSSAAMSARRDHDYLDYPPSSRAEYDRRPPPGFSGRGPPPRDVHPRGRYDDYSDSYDDGYDDYDGYGGYGGHPPGMTMVPMMMPGGQMGYMLAPGYGGPPPAHPHHRHPHPDDPYRRDSYDPRDYPPPHPRSAYDDDLPLRKRPRRDDSPPPRGSYLLPSSRGPPPPRGPDIAPRYARDAYSSGPPPPPPPPPGRPVAGKAASGAGGAAPGMGRAGSKPLGGPVIGVVAGKAAAGAGRGGGPGRGPGAPGRGATGYGRGSGGRG